jgi:hypothetical protein
MVPEQNDDRANHRCRFQDIEKFESRVAFRMPIFFHFSGSERKTALVAFHLILRETDRDYSLNFVHDIRTCDNLTLNDRNHT